MSTVVGVRHTGHTTDPSFTPDIKSQREEGKKGGGEEGRRGGVEAEGGKYHVLNNQNRTYACSPTPYYHYHHPLLVNNYILFI